MTTGIEMSLTAGLLQLSAPRVLSPFRGPIIYVSIPDGSKGVLTTKNLSASSTCARPSNAANERDSGEFDRLTDPEGEPQV